MKLKGSLLLLSLVLGIGSSASATELAGSASISDGDTVTVAGQKIRLLGVDAPETDQVCLDANSNIWPCGIVARDALIKKTAGQAWKCEGSKRDRYHRLLATCFVGGEDIDSWVVREGWALSFVRYGHTYDADEKAARDA